jgi:hypothetical protein
MSKENIFDLSKIVPKSNEVEVKENEIKSGSELNDMEYDLVDKSDWDKIPHKSYIRYEKADGTITKGGYVKSIYKKKDDPSYIKIDMVTNFSQNNLEWTIYAKNLNKIWKKKNYEIDVTKNNSSENVNYLEMAEEIDICKQSIDHLKKEMQKMTNEQIRTLNLIKKLHKIE